MQPNLTRYIKNGEGDWIQISPSSIINIGKKLPFTASPPLQSHKKLFKLPKSAPLSLEECFASVPSNKTPPLKSTEPSIVKRMRECGVSEDKIQQYLNIY